MKPINQYISNQQQIENTLQSSKQPTMNEQSIFSEKERDSTAYFFVLLRSAYGAEYLRHFPDDESVRLGKRFWAKTIGQYSREKIDQIFNYLKTEKARGNEDYYWLDIGNILAIAGNNWQHAMQSRPVDVVLGRDGTKALPDLTTRERHRAEQKAKLAKLRTECGI